jgi:hypothetical protein
VRTSNPTLYVFVVFPVCSRKDKADLFRQWNGCKKKMDTLSDDLGPSVQMKGKQLEELQEVCYHNKWISCIKTCASSKVKVFAESICTTNLYYVSVFITLFSSFFDSFFFCDFLFASSFIHSSISHSIFSPLFSDASYLFCFSFSHLQIIFLFPHPTPPPLFSKYLTILTYSETTEIAPSFHIDSS